MPSDAALVNALCEKSVNFLTSDCANADAYGRAAEEREKEDRDGAIGTTLDCFLFAAGRFDR